MILTCT